MNINLKLLQISIVISSLLGAVLLFFLFRAGGNDTHLEAYASESPSRETEEADVDDGIDQQTRAVLDNLITQSGQINDKAVEALKAAGPDIIPVLLMKFNGTNDPEQKALLSVLQTYNTYEVTEHLILTLESSPDTAMAIRIGHAIHAEGNEQFCNRLCELTTNPAPTLRLGAAIALRSCPADRSAGDLLRLIREEQNPAIGKEALISLSSAPQAFIRQALDIALAHESPQVRYNAVAIIDQRNFSDYSENLRNMLRNDPSNRVRKACARALVSFRERAGR